jgi:hypothetical protein
MGIDVTPDKPKRRLLSAVLRRDNDYIHVVLFRGILTKEQLLQNGFEIGSYPDPTHEIELHSRAEIDSLIKLLKKTAQQI